MSASRKQIRDWFRAAIESSPDDLGRVFSTRWVHLKEEDRNFVSVYLLEGSRTDELAYGYLHELAINIHQTIGDDDSLDDSAESIFQALANYNETNPSPFNFDEDGYLYGGESTDQTIMLTLRFTVTQ